MSKENRFDVLVVGGGHAGTEAALASARLGAKTALLSFSRNTIGQMSCNPAIGGVGKGQLVKEIDALFGEMGCAIDDTGIQFRTLNSSKGPAARSSRAQADRELYRKRILSAVENCENLTILEGAATKVLSDGNRVIGIETEDGSQIFAKASVITTGTFLRGLMHTGETKTEGGRVGERQSSGLSDSFAELGLRLGRMKTGTPPRFSKKTINLSILEEQLGDTPIKPFSFRTKKIDRPQVSCWMTATNLEAHEFIRNNVDRSPMFNGQIKSSGPRYCPSIEDKVFRFKDKQSHTIFLEPEGFDSDLVYPNGISTSLPMDVQEQFVRSIRGLENVTFLKYGYAVEYDHVDPLQLDLRLAPRDLLGIFFAGQICGTSGYEEAGAQGLIAGLNAALSVQGRDPFILSRSESYIGVMIDDLTNLGVTEPYRMFTARAEYRLHLREDNADFRLTRKARDLGLVDDANFKRFELKEEQLVAAKNYLNTTIIKPVEVDLSWLSSLETSPISDAISLSTLIKRPEITLSQLTERFHGFDLEEADLDRLQTEIKFEGYLSRQNDEIKRTAKMEFIAIPEDFHFSSVPGLSNEVREKLTKFRPENLSQASRISGVTPVAISLISVFLKKHLGRSPSDNLVG
jgi:tRNA uridine 5-carboxymethylaminomethyl modification enzyme